MNCPSCGRAHKPNARFCGGCGKPLAQRCAACGAESEPDAQFCETCGAALVARPARPTDEAVARKVVTIVFADLIGSTSLHERLDAESTRRLMDRYYRALHGAVEAHDGTVVKLLGDGVMAAFGVPRVAEDDAIRAVRAAVDMQRAFRELVAGQASATPAIGLRVAVNTGEVVVSDDQHDVVGDPVNVAARLQQEAQDGDVVIGESTRRLVSELVTLAPLGAISLKGRSETVGAYRVVSLDRPAGVIMTPFVGRDDELRRVMAIYDTAVKAPRAHLAVVLGSPGLGKSRLTAELARRLGTGTTVLTAHCDSAGGATFAPLAEALRNFLRIDDGATGDSLRAAIEAAVPAEDPERARIAAGVAALLTGTPATPEETFFVVRRLFAGLAAVQPVMLVIDDLHWAEPLLLDLTEHLVQWGAGVPLLVLAAARPELRDVRASLAVAGGVVSDVVMLTGLDAGAATRLAANVVGASELPAAIAGRVLATSEGNPLFLGELVRMLVDDGVLRQEGDRWIAAVDLAEIEVPPTIQALLAARIERLRSEERTVLERAAVIGRQFSRAALVHLLPPELHTDLDARLESLRRGELIESDTGWFLGEPVLRFHHALVRDAAYRRILKGTRAELHARFAGWIESRVSEAGEHEEMIGWHLEQAHQHLGELGPIDDSGRAFGERAARYLAAAGRRALARDDLAPAASLFERALDRLDGSDSARADLALDWCEALLAAGDVGPGANAIAELGRFTEGSDRLRAWHTCFAGQLVVLTDPQALRATADAVAAAADDLASAGDAAGEAKAYSVHALTLARLGKIGACEAALDRALAAARRAHDRRRANAVLAGAPLAALWGPSPVTRASGRCLDVVRVLRITQGAPAVEAVALRCQGVLEALRGRTDAARRMIASSRRMVEELGITQRLLEADVFAGLIELLEGNAVAAERCLRSAYEGLRDHGLGIDAAQAAALLGRALLAQGRAEEAEALSHESEALAGDDLKAAIAWRGVRAEALARRGAHAPAVELARAAVDIAAATDALLDHADARLALATALRAAGRGSEADAEEARTIELWEAKGATLLAERARRAAGYVVQTAGDSNAPAAPTLPVAHRVRANSATAHAGRMVAAMTARDADALSTLLADSVETVHHPTGEVFDREGNLAGLRMLLGSDNPTFELDALATLGESLVLCRHTVSASGVAHGQSDIGAFCQEQILLIEVDEQGRARRTEFFASDRLGEAIARVYERYADLLPAGPERTRAAATARSVAAQLGPFGIDSMPASFAPAVEFVDHRALGFGAMRGALLVLQRLRSLFEVSADIATRVDDVLALRSDALLVRWTNFGTQRVGGGVFGQHFLMLFVFGNDGLVMRNELFDADRDDEALARFDALTAEPAATRFANAASRAVDCFERCWRARDWDAVAATFTPTHVMDDRRVMMRLRLEGDAYFASLRGVFDAMPTSRWDFVLLATRGERLALFRVEITGAAGDSGPLVRELFWVVEVDADGRRSALVTFDLDDVDAAYAELDERHVAGEGAPYAGLLANWRAFRQAANARDWDTVRRVLPDDFTMLSHRRLANTGTRLSRDEFIASLSRGDDRGVRSKVRRDHLPRLCGRALMEVVTVHGNVDGGDFEQQFIIVIGYDARHPYTSEAFDLDQVHAALARYEELATEPLASRFANAAARAVARMERFWEARDWNGLVTLHAPTLRMDDRRSLVGVPLSGDEFLTNLRLMFDLPKSRWHNELRATRGARLALFACHLTGGIDAASQVEFEHLSLIEVDAAERYVALTVFDAHDADAAYAELDERYAAGEAAGASTALTAIGRAFAVRDWHAVEAQLAPDLVVHDHRPLGWETLHGPTAYIASLQSLVDLAPDAQLRADHITRFADRVLAIATWVGTREGGAFEAPRVVVGELDELGRVRRYDFYNLDQLDQAKARFEVLGDRGVTPRIDNAATRVGDRMNEALAARDWERLTALFARDFRSIDRRKMAQIAADREQYLQAFRPMFDELSFTMTVDVIAARGDRLVLVKVDWTGSGDSVGPIEDQWIDVVEVNDHGELATLVTFEPDDLGAAYAELDERYAANEAGSSRRAALTRAFTQAFAARDWDMLSTLLAPDLVVNDHRLLGWETLHGPAAYIQALRSLVDLAPDVQLRIDHMMMSGPRFLYVTTWVGTRDGGPFESPSVILCELDEVGRIRRFDQYDLDRLEEVRARLEPSDVSAGKPARHAHDPLLALLRPNAATAASERVQAAFAARDWSAMRAACAPHAKFEDRRPHARVSGDADWWIADAQGIVQTTPDVRYERQLVATAGERVALDRVLWKGTSTTGGAVEVEYLRMTETDAAGRISAMIGFDLNDRRAALREAWARWLAADASAATVMPPLFEFIEGINDHDRPRLRAVLADDVVVNDFRRTGQGRVDGADAYLDTLAVLWNLAPDIQLDASSVVAHAHHGAVGIGRFFGTLHDGGPFEYCLANVATVASGRISRLEFFELENLNAALRRFAELRPHSGPVLRSPAEGGGLRRTCPDPLRIPPNTATRASDRWRVAFEAQDWDTLQALYAPTLVFDERRRFSVGSGDRDTFVASDRWMASRRTRVARTVLATAGDRLALEHRRWTAAVEAAPFEVETLHVIEVDGEGRVAANIVFDTGDRRAASLEMFDRYWRGEGARWTPPSQIEFVRALNDHDLDRMRAALPADFYFYDHRRTGVGRLGNADDYVASMAAVYEQSPDVTTDTLYHVAVDHHGSVSVGRMFGTLVDGGEFESLFVRLNLYQDGQGVGAELFEIEDVEIARRRFEELRPAPTHIPPNAATRANERCFEPIIARDWPALRALTSADFTFDDRRKRALVHGDIELWIRNLEVVLSWGVSRRTRELIGTVGDRIALERFAFLAGEAGAAIDGEFLRVTEVDADRRLRAVIHFDLDDRRAAFVEAQTRFASGEAAAIGGQAPIAALHHGFGRALTQNDWAGVQGCLADDLVFHDHRVLGLGILPRDAWIESLRAQHALAPDMRGEQFRILAWDRHGRVDVQRIGGTMPDGGGAFENVFIRVIVTAGDRIRHYEIFDVGDVDQAVARFSALCAHPA